MAGRLIHLAATLMMLTPAAGCSSNATCPGTMQRLDALLLWQTPPDMGEAFYDKAYYYADTCPTQETTAALRALSREPAADARKP
jgi:hypothetical protein